MRNLCLILFFNFFFMLAADAQNKGLMVKQDPATLPKSRGTADPVFNKASLTVQPSLEKQDGNYILKGGWRLTAAADLPFTDEQVAARYHPEKGYPAVVPGTVLTTLVANGVYPDPYYGLNNLLIPDTLCRQNWWYSKIFDEPEGESGKMAELQFEGINYEAGIWLNGHYLGDMKGAFIRGKFDVSTWLKKKDNVLAVKIIPPPHPGIPHEESEAAGTGPNGGQLCLDGPTFISSEGWDWIPGIRDRNIGIWQDVRLHFTRGISLENPQVISHLPLPDTTKATLDLSVTVKNQSDKVQHALVKVLVDQIQLNKEINLQPKEERIVHFSPSEFSKLYLANPRLWWPNGYGRQALYDARFEVINNEIISDSLETRFGVREISYELSVAGEHQVQRLIYDPVKDNLKLNAPPFNQIKRKDVGDGVNVPTFSEGTDSSLFEAENDTTMSPYLVIRVNGVRIFCKGGNWGMDDGMKRVSRERMEPYFKLSKNAHFNMLRNWTGENTEKVFYDLCDEYGMLVWNDFWMSTQGYNLEPLDHDLFLKNAEDVILRYRNHPSIAIWCPRNEGYAPEDLERQLSKQVFELDGTRYYQGNSRYLNLRPSGPWHYQKDPAVYFEKIAKGFNTELGSPSVPEAASIRNMMQDEDTWPIGDVWYYHDFHDGQKEYVNAIHQLYGTPENLEEFTDEAQMVNYNSYRTMFESWNSKMWNNTSGLLLWMSQPAWPSTVWQVYGSNYEAFGSYYGSQKACEPVHIQMNEPQHELMVVNASTMKIQDARIIWSIYNLKGQKLKREEFRKTLTANSRCVFNPVWPAVNEQTSLVRLQLLDSSGQLLSENDYLLQGKEHDFRDLKDIPEPVIAASLDKHTSNQLLVELQNHSDNLAVFNRLMIKDRQGREIHPAYYSDNYFNLLPGEKKQVAIQVNTATVASIELKTYHQPAKVILKLPQ